MRCDTTHHPLYGGIDLHARTMSVCILRQDGAVGRHRKMPAPPDALLKAIAPSREGRVIAVAGLLPWDWRADRGAHAGLPVVLGHALSRQAMPGGKATNDQSDAQNSAVRLRGGMLPHASVYPAAMRATRDHRRRRRPLTRPRAALRAHLPHTNRQDTLPESGNKLAYKGHRDGGAERCLAPAVPQSVEIDLALIDPDDQGRRDGALTIVQTAQPHQAPALDRLPPVPGIGKRLRWVLR